MRRIVILAFPSVQTLDVLGPAEVFSTATRLARSGGYSVEMVAAQAGPLPTSSVALHPDRTLEDCRGRIDTLIVAGGRGVSAASADERLIAWLRAAALRSRRVASVCTGAFLLARTGLLDGRRATTHWARCASTSPAGSSCSSSARAGRRSSARSSRRRSRSASRCATSKRGSPTT